MSHRKDFDRDGEPLRVTAKSLGDRRHEVMVGDRRYEIEATVLPDGRIRFELAGKRYVAAAGQAGANDLHIDLGDQAFLLTAHTGRRRSSHAIVADGVIEAPMTGTVLKINVTEGATVTADQTVAVITAMKMEHKLAAGIDGTVTEIATSEGTAVDQGALLLRIE